MSSESKIATSVKASVSAAQVVGPKALQKKAVGVIQNMEAPEPDVEHEAHQQALQPKLKINPPIQNTFNPIQRVVQIRHSVNTWADLMAERGDVPLGKKELSIFNNWHRSATQHDFASAEKLNDALAAAEETRETEPGTNAIPSRGLPDPPALYRAANLRFMTSTGGARLETLYFNDGVNSARMRQQHSSGPLVQDPRQGKVDYFGARGVLDQIKAEVKSEQKKTLNQRGFEMVRDIIHQNYAANEVFQLNQNHLEVWYDAAGNYDNNNHMSQGVTVANPGYTDQEIKTIYSKVVGRIP